jgi:CheY-like chemotaxis protein
MTPGDLMLPNLDGLQVWRRISRQDPTIRLILVTVDADRHIA